MNEYPVTEIVPPKSLVLPTFFAFSASIQKKFEYFEVLCYNSLFEKFEVLMKKE